MNLVNRRAGKKKKYMSSKQGMINLYIQKKLWSINIWKLNQVFLNSCVKEEIKRKTSVWIELKIF